MTLRDYLKVHTGTPAGSQPHRRLIRDIICNPDKLGIVGGLEIFTEVAMYEDDVKIGSVDVVEYSPEQLYLIEAKVIWGNNRSGNVNETNRQLKKAYDYFEKHFGVKGKMIGVVMHTRAKKFRHYELLA